MKRLIIAALAVASISANAAPLPGLTLTLTIERYGECAFYRYRLGGDYGEAMKDEQAFNAAALTLARAYAEANPVSGMNRDMHAGTIYGRHLEKGDAEAIRRIDPRGDRWLKSSPKEIHQAARALYFERGCDALPKAAK